MLEPAHPIPFRSRRSRLVHVALLVLASGQVGSSAGAQPLDIGELVVADDGSDAIIAIDPADGSKRVVASGGSLVAPHAVAVDPRTLQVYVADREAGTGPLGAILRIDPAAYNPGSPASNQQIVAQDGQLEEPLDVFVERDGQLLVAEGGGIGGVVRVNPATGAQTRVFDHASSVGVLADLSGTVYAASSIGANEIRRKAAAAPPPPDLVSAGGLFTVNGHMAFEQDGTIVIVDLGVQGALDGQVIRVNPGLIDTGHPEANQTLLSNATNLVDPRGVAVGASGEIFVADPAAEAGVGAVYRIDRVSGAQTLVASGAPLADPIGIDVARSGLQWGDIAVADSGFQHVVIVDPDTSAQRLVRNFAPMFPVDVEFDANDDLLVLLAQGGSSMRPRVVRMDPVTGLSAPVHVAGPSSTNDFAVPTRFVRDGTHLFVADSATFVSPTFQMGAIFDVNLQTGAKTLVTGGGVKFRATAIAILPGDGDFLVGTANSSLDSFDLVRVDRVNLAREVITTDGDLLSPADVVIDTNGNTAYVAARTGLGGSGAVVAVDVAAKTQSPFSDPGDVIGPVGIAFDRARDLVVSHKLFLPSQGQVVRFDRDVADPPAQLVSGGGLLNTPAGLAVYLPEPRAGFGLAIACLALAVLGRSNGRARARATPT